MTPMLPSPFLQCGPADEAANATVDVTFDAACEQLQALAGLPEPRDLDLEQAVARFSIELRNIVHWINGVGA